MAHGKSDEERIRGTHNTARYFTENRHVAWVVLVFTLLWGLFGLARMPKRKDPEIPVRVAAAIATWPGAPATKIEELLTRRLEETIAQNSKIEKIESNTRGGVSVILFTLQPDVADTGKEFDDIRLKIDTIRDLPQGALPIQFIKDFGDTTALMLTVASPKASDVEVQLRAGELRRGIEATREKAGAGKGGGRRATLAYAFPATVDAKALEPTLEQMGRFAAERGVAKDVRVFSGPGFLGLDGETSVDESALKESAERFLRDRVRTSELHPDVWRPVVIVDPADTEARLRAVAGSKYSYRELDDFTDILQRRLQAVPEVSKVSRAGVLPERVYLHFSQERLASYGLQVGQLENILSARNITLPGGVLETQGKNLSIDPSGELKSEREIGDVALAASPAGAPVYLRDLFDIQRGYEAPPRFLNDYTWKDAKGEWQRTRAVTLAVSMRSGLQIDAFARSVDAALGEVRQLLPEDLVLAGTSDQPKQVDENIELFMSSLYEAVALVVVVALIGFWEWRSALVMALCIPITLMMTYGFMNLVGIDLQQISIASLIIALGLLVDDPVVAGDAIKRELSLGHPPIVASWLGPTKLATAILFATITNIVAYLPFLSLPGDVGRFIFTLPVVLTASLVASRLVSMTFIPLLGYYLLRAPKKTHSLEEARQFGFARLYYAVVGRAIDHRWAVLGISFAVMGGGVWYAKGLKQAFFPKDLSYLSYVDIWLPEDAPLSATQEAAQKADEIIRRTLDVYGKAHAAKGKSADILESLTTFIGGGGPRFWFSVTPEQQQLNYAQILLQTKDKHDTQHIIEPLQHALSAEIPGARIDVRQLENGKPVGIPVSFRIAGTDIDTLRDTANKAKAILRRSPLAERVRDDWGADSFSVKLEVDPDRANLAGVSNSDVAMSSAFALSGHRVGTLREGNKLIPIVSRLRGVERGQLSDIQNLYVYSARTNQRVPLSQVSKISYGMVTEKIRRRNQYRTITVSAFPAPDKLPSEVVASVRGELKALASSLPPGVSFEVGGEEEEQKKGFKDLAVVLLISIAAIFLALVVQFKNAVKPFIVFAAIPYGVVGALVCLAATNSPFGFMAFLGIISLIGVIVSHVIVLFDFIEERHAEGETLRQALLDAGIERLRPVAITVGATVFALFPLASHGGPLWEPLCYAQIGGLTIATFITLLMVPVIYAIFVMDLKLIRWDENATSQGTEEEDAHTHRTPSLHASPSSS